jgi:hypothetical protein
LLREHSQETVSCIPGLYRGQVCLLLSATPGHAVIDRTTPLSIH